MSNINKNKNDNSAEVINPQTSMLSVTEVNNLINNENNKEKEYKYTGQLRDLFLYVLKYKENNEMENINNNIPISLPKIFKDRANFFECEFYKYNDIRRTEGFYKEGKYSSNIKDYRQCLLLIKENYLYILNKDNRKNIFNMYINPENSFLDKLETQSIVSKEEAKYIKYDYELSRPLLCLNYNLLTCSLIINKRYQEEFTILILGTKKQYSFIIQDQNLKNKFCYILGTFIYNSDGYMNNKLNLIFSHSKTFNSKTYITPDYFEYIAKTGDIVLFQTNHILTKAQRCYTCDNYDHIALVYSNYGFPFFIRCFKKK